MSRQGGKEERGGGEDTHTRTKKTLLTLRCPKYKVSTRYIREPSRSAASARCLLAQGNTHSHTCTRTYTHTFTDGEVRELGGGCVFFFFSSSLSLPRSIETALSSFLFQNDDHWLCPCFFFCFFFKKSQHIESTKSNTNK